MVKILPILIGVLVSYAVALVTGAVDFQTIGAAAWFGIPLHKDSMGLFAIDGSETFISAVFTIVPIALATMMEHIGDIAAISATTGKNYIRDPGLNKTLLGDGLATAMAGLLGGPANTTYGENTGVLALTKIYDPLVIRIAAVFAMILSSREVPPQKLSPREPAKTVPFPREAPAKNRKIKIFQKNLPKQAGICRPDCVLY